MDYKRKYYLREAKAAALDKELLDAKREIAALKKKPTRCEGCGSDFVPSQNHLRRGMTVYCRACIGLRKQQASEMWRKRQRKRLDRRALIVSGPRKPCRVCGIEFQPTPSQYRNYNYICLACRYAKDKERRVNAP